MHVLVRIELKWLSDLIQTIIHSNSFEKNIEDYMLPGISELQPRRVSWSDNRTHHNCTYRKHYDGLSFFPRSKHHNDSLFILSSFIMIRSSFRWGITQY